MKKLLLLSLSLFLFGCGSVKEKEQPANIRYKDIYKLIIDNDKFLDTSMYYDFSVDIVALKDGTYRYYVFIDNPQVAMYDIEVLMIDQDINTLDMETMSPSIGIYENKEYNMIPYQVNTENNFVKGLVLSGITTKKDIILKGVIQWKNSNRSITYKEYITTKRHIAKEPEVEETTTPENNNEEKETEKKTNE
ncbi:MAG: hypothetical protein Q4A47_06305 [Erysipelotrichaceae bacterium]|nr:hypothetical protein [Erysipelotrichaceae bacterium]